MKFFHKCQRGAISSSLVKIGIFAAVALIVIGLAVNFVPTMMTGFEAGRTHTANTIDSWNNVTTADNDSVAVNLTYSIWQDSASEVVSVSSNKSEDSPTASAVIDSSSINVTGLHNTADTVRTLTMNYNYGTAGQYTGYSTVIGMGPGLIILGFVVVVAVKHFMGIKHS